MYKNTIIWKEYIIYIKLASIKLPTPDSPPWEWLKYYKAIHNLSQTNIAIKLGMTEKERYLIQSIESDHNYPSRKLSKKLAILFKTNTKYFYDDYYLFLDSFPKIILDYRIKHNISKLELSKLLGLSYDMICRWERKTSVISRKNYCRLKNILQPQYKIKEP